MSITLEIEFIGLFSGSPTLNFYTYRLYDHFIIKIMRILYQERFSWESVT